MSNSFLSPHDRELFEKYVAGLLTYEDALRQAENVNHVRVEIKLHERRRWFDDDEAGGVAVSPPRPNKPGPLNSYAEPPNENEGDT